MKELTIVPEFIAYFRLTIFILHFIKKKTKSVVKYLQTSRPINIPCVRLFAKAVAAGLHAEGLAGDRVL